MNWIFQRVFSFRSTTTPLLLDTRDKSEEHAEAPELTTPAETLRFKCLQGRSVVEAAISDHNPVLLETSHGVVCSFNILMQCAPGNNGFARTETPEQYQERLLGPITQVLQELANVYNVTFFMLQEAPNPKIGAEFYSKLRRVLPNIFIDENCLFKDIASEQLGAISTSGGVFTMYPKTYQAQEVTQRPDILNNICSANRKRFQAFELYNDAGDHALCIANFHGEFRDQAGMQADIKFLVLQNYIVAGDFNLLQMPDLGVSEADALTDPAMQFPYRTYDGIYDGTTLMLLTKLRKIFGCC